MLVSLSCFHVMNFKPPAELGDLLWCTACCDWREAISDAEPTVYRIRCCQCKYPRSFGADEEAAFRAAAKHLTRQPRHVVRITMNGQLVKEMRDETLPLPLSAIVEWLNANPEHQGSLRELILAKQGEKDISV